MYSLDINFLNDRTERPTEVAGPQRPKDSPVPLYAGIAVALLLPALAAGLWFFLQNRNAELERRKADLDNQLIQVQSQLQAVEAANAEVARIEAQNQALASVFDRIKPWSAILQDIRDRVPAGVQIGLIEQSPQTDQPVVAPPTDPNQPPAAVPEPPPAKIEISGIATSFDGVNDFLLTLQRSPFLDRAATRLVSAELVADPTQVDIAQERGSSAQVEVQLDDVVQYSIESTLTPRPTTELLEDLDRTLAVGLSSRIEALRNRGVIQK